MILAAEMWFLWRMMNVPWTAKVSNKIILQMANEALTLIKDIRKRQSDFFGHIIRKEQIEHIVKRVKFQGGETGGDNGRRFWMSWQIGWERGQSRE
jgi:hypothetical protein